MTNERIKSSSAPILLYVPNLMGYARILLAFVGLHLSTISSISLSQPTNDENDDNTDNNYVVIYAIGIWISSSILDLFDGIVARKYNQCSSFGILLDVIADNILRTTIWIACIILSIVTTTTTSTTTTTTTASTSCLFIIPIPTFIICVEWITMICTQLHSKTSGGGSNHWKLKRETDPWFIQQVFRNNFKSPLGSLVIYGLYGSNLCLYGSYHSVIYNNIPYFTIFKYVAYSGRMVALLVELKLCNDYVSYLILTDNDEKNE